MKVEILEAGSRFALEEEINIVLSRHTPSEIFDIKYTGSGNRAMYSSDYYSAMIIFK